MLHRSLHDIALGALLGSPGMAATLLGQLRDRRSGLARGDDTARLRRECRSTLVDALDKAWPRRFRLNELERIADHLCTDTLFATPALPVLDQAFAELMMRDGDLVHYQARQVDAFARLASEIDPTLVVGWHLAGWMAGARRPGRGDVERVVDAQQPLFAPPPVAGVDVADNHVHLGGVSADDFVLARHLLDAGGLSTRTDWQALQRLRALVALFMHPRRGNHAAAPTDEGASGALSFAALRRACREQPELASRREVDWWIASRITVGGQAVDVDWLRHRVAVAMVRGDIARAWIWLVLLVWRLFRQDEASVALRVAIMLFFCEVNMLRRKLVTDGQGLRRFTRDYYGAELRHDALVPGAVHDRDTMRRLLVTPGDRAELKITPGAFEPALAERLARSRGTPADVLAGYRGAVSARARRVLDAAELDHVDALEQWHFCAHFIRRRAAANPPAAGSGRAGSESGLRTGLRRDELWREAEQLARRLRRQAGWSRSAFLGGAMNGAFTFLPGRWLRGLDVAGDETAWPIEIFAPQLRWLRQGLLSRPDGEPASRGFHLSVHAGEDYGHPLSGLRHVDETVRFCEMREGDRLGHALALGVEPAKWMARHGDVLLPVEEHVDNLVWAWQQAVALAPRLDLAAQVIPRLEMRIERFAPRVPWLRGTDARPIDLHAAWALRRNCTRQLRAAHATRGVSPARALLTDKLLAGAPDHAQLLRAMSGDGGEASHRHFLARMAVEEGSVQETLRRVSGAASADDAATLVRVRWFGDAAAPLRQEWLADEQRGDDGKRLLDDHELTQDLEFMEALQDHLLTRYDELGLWIETNPSSNVYIARVESHADHPIFRWHPPDPRHLEPKGRFNRFGLRRGPMPVLINTDDPGIMPTTLRMELELVKNAAIDLEHARSSAEAWVDGIRRAGLAQFERNHLPVFHGVRRR